MSYRADHSRWVIVVSRRWRVRLLATGASQHGVHDDQRRRDRTTGSRRRRPKRSTTMPTASAAHARLDRANASLSLLRGNRARNEGADRPRRETCWASDVSAVCPLQSEEGAASTLLCCLGHFLMADLNSVASSSIDALSFVTSALMSAFARSRLLSCVDR